MMIPGAELLAIELCTIACSEVAFHVGYTIVSLPKATATRVLRRELALLDYRGAFWPKSRAKTMAEKEARLLNG